MIIGIHGKKQHGKDTVANLIKKLDKEREWEVHKFAHGIKEIAAKALGCNIEDFESEDIKKKLLPDEWSPYEYTTHVELVNLFFDEVQTLSPTQTHEFFKHKGWEPEVPGETFYWKRQKGKPMTIRKFLQKIGTEAMRENIHEDFWVNYLFGSYTEDDNWIVTDVRFPNEMQRIQELGGIVIKVVRPNIESTDNHLSEIALDHLENEDFDCVLSNSSTLTVLEDAVKHMLKVMEQSFFVIYDDEDDNG